MHEDDVDHQFRRLQYFMVPESEHMVAAPPQTFRADVPLLSFEIMLAAVQVDDQAVRYAREVGDEQSDRMLAAEAHAELPASKVVPETRFGVRR